MKITKKKKFPPRKSSGQCQCRLLDKLLYYVMLRYNSKYVYRWFSPERKSHFFKPTCTAPFKARQLKYRHFRLLHFFKLSNFQKRGRSCYITRVAV